MAGEITDAFGRAEEMIRARDAEIERLRAALRDIKSRAYAGRNDFDNFTSYQLNLIEDTAANALNDEQTVEGKK